jgi:hypothetical protein
VAHARKAWSECQRTSRAQRNGNGGNDQDAPQHQVLDSRLAATCVIVISNSVGERERLSL